MSARISLPDDGPLTSEQSAIVASVLNGRRGELVGPLRAALHSPELAARWSKLGEFLRYDTVLGQALSELSILLVARRWNCELEWAIHKREALKAGVSDAIVSDIRDVRRPRLTDDVQSACYEYVASILNWGNVPDSLHRAVSEKLGERGAVELTALIGYYSMVAITLNAHSIPLPRGIEPELLAAGSSDTRQDLTLLPMLGAV